jgi:hypothetical protein
VANRCVVDSFVADGFVADGFVADGFVADRIVADILFLIYVMDHDTQNTHNLRWRKFSPNVAICAFIGLLSVLPLHSIAVALGKHRS